MKPAAAGGPYKVPRQHNNARSAMLAGAMHLVLLLFLWVGIHWQNNAPVAVEAEVWDMSVQSAAPPPPPPTPEPEPEPVEKTPPPAPPVEAPPTPKEPDIALERLKAKVKAEKEKQEALKQERLKKEAEEKKLAEKKAKEEKDKKDKEAKEAAEKKAQADKLAKAKQDKLDEKKRAAELQRILGTVGAGTTGTAPKSTGPRSDGGYEAAIRGKIKSNLSYSSTDDSLSATFRITQLPTGEIIGIRKIKSSGSPAYDGAIENAINRSSPLPKKKDGTVERELELVFNLKDLH